ncbi:MAG: glycerate kinase, partial [Acinetobacter sp.]
NQIASIDITQLDPRLADVEIVIATDVNNPLIGPHGATYIFGPQKGATPDMLIQLEANLCHFADIIQQTLGISLHHVKGAGAAGGLAAGLMAFTTAKIQSGVETVIESIQLAQKIEAADYIFTGEGGIDIQTQFGKTPIGVARLAKTFNKPVFVCAGYIGQGIEMLYEDGITAIFGILDGASNIEQACKNGAMNLTRTTENIGRLIKQLESTETK